MTDQTLATPPPLPKAPRSFTPYIMGWALLASLALVYLVLLAMKPDTLARYFPAAPAVGSPETNEGQRAGTDALAEVQSLRQTLDQAQQEIATLKTQISGHAEREADLASRLTTLEGKVDRRAAGPETAAASPPAIATTPITSAAGKNAAKPEVTKPGTPVAIAPAPAVATTTSVIDFLAEPAQTTSTPGLKVINAPPPAAAVPPPTPSFETGSVAKQAPNAPIAFGPAVVKPAPKPVGIQLGSGDTVDGLRLNWSLLADRHGTSLKNLEPRYVTGVDANGLTYELIAGPVKSTADAKKLCKDLEAKAVPCKVIDDFRGEAL